MIPTRSKSKLSQDLSFPIGAQAVSEGLTGVPHYDDIELSFSVYAVYPDSDFRRYLREELPYRIIQFDYRPATNAGYVTANDMVEWGWNDPKWELAVYPVLRSRRHEVNQFIREQGLPAIRQWLQSSEAVGWEDHQHTLKLVFNFADGSLSVTTADGA